MKFFLIWSHFLCKICLTPMYAHMHTHTSIHTNTLSVYVFTIWFFFPHAPLWVSLEFSRSCCWVEECLMEKGMKFAFQDPPSSSPEQLFMLHTVYHPLLAFLGPWLRLHMHTSLLGRDAWGEISKCKCASKYRFSPTYLTIWTFVSFWLFVWVVVYDSSDMILLQWKPVKLQILTHDLFPG